MSSTFAPTASRTASGSTSKARINVCEEICSAAAIRSPGLARRVFAFSNFPSRFLKLDDHLVPQFKLVLKIVVYPCSDFLDFGSSKLRNRCLDFLYRAHPIILADRPQSQKPKNDV